MRLLYDTKKCCWGHLSIRSDNGISAFHQQAFEAPPTDIQDQAQEQRPQQPTSKNHKVDILIGRTETMETPKERAASCRLLPLSPLLSWSAALSPGSIYLFAHVAYHINAILLIRMPLFIYRLCARAVSKWRVVDLHQKGTGSCVVKHGTSHCYAALEVLLIHTYPCSFFTCDNTSLAPSTRTARDFMWHRS